MFQSSHITFSHYVFLMYLPDQCDYPPLFNVFLLNAHKNLQVTKGLDVNCFITRKQTTVL